MWHSLTTMALVLLDSASLYFRAYFALPDSITAPDGTPVIGRAGFQNLYLNTGHGKLGWTMAAGSGRVLADLVSGRTPEIETADLSLARYG